MLLALLAGNFPTSPPQHSHHGDNYQRQDSGLRHIHKLDVLLKRSEKRQVVRVCDRREEPEVPVQGPWEPEPNHAVGSEEDRFVPPHHKHRCATITEQSQPLPGQRTAADWKTQGKFRKVREVAAGRTVTIIKRAPSKVVLHARWDIQFDTVYECKSIVSTRQVSVETVSLYTVTNRRKGCARP